MTEHKRLTERDEFDNADIIGVSSADIQLNLNFAEFNRVTNALNKLADYEDAEETGTLVRLPCKVGDTVYYINKRPHIALYLNTIYKAEVVRIVTTRLGTSLVIQIHNEHGCTEIPDIKDFGKIVFLTREDAEKALKEREEQ